MIPRDRSGPVFASGSPQGSWMVDVKKAAPTDFPRLLEEWKAAFPEGDNYLEGRPENALRWLFGTWLTKDPKGFLKIVTAPQFEYSHWAAQVMVRTMPEKAAELIFGPTHGELDEYFVFDGAGELAKHSPALYLKMNPGDTIDLQPDSHRSNDDWETAIASLAKTDAVAAGNACLRWKVEKNSSAIERAFLTVASAWKTGDPPMKEWVDGITEPVLRNLANHARLCVLAEKDPRAALAELYSPKFEEGREVNTPREILSQFAKADPVGALKLLKDVEGIFSKYKSGPFDEGSAEEVEKAANPFKDLSPGRYAAGNEVEENGVRYAILGEAAGNLPDDPTELFATLKKWSADTESGDSAWQLGVEADLIRRKGQSMSAADCLTMAGLWAEKLKGGTDDTTFKKLAARVAEVNPELALASLDQLPESARPSFAGEIIKQFPDSDPAGNIALFPHLTAVQWDEEFGKILGANAAAYAEAIASLPASTTLGARESFMEKWGDQDPEAAAQWLESLPDDAVSKPAAAGLFHAWAAYDEEAAVAWVATLPAGPIRDTVAGNLAYSIARRQPDEAWQWVESISDPKVQAKARLDLDFRWEYDAPEKFRAALDEARLAAGWPKRGAKPPPPDPSDDPFR
ncbi:MAG: hypothetical protein ABIT37_13490 [Luteolibacter sp.]